MLILSKVYFDNVNIGDNTPLYIHKGSNHPPSILKNIPHAVNDRLSRISANEQLFNEAALIYHKALDESGFSPSVKWAQEQAKKNYLFQPSILYQCEDQHWGQISQNN